MARFNASNALCKVFEDDEAGEASSDESADECEIHDSDDEDNDEELEEDAQITDTYNLIPASTSHSSQMSGISFKKPVYISSAASSMSIASERFLALPVKQSEAPSTPISSNNFFSRKLSNQSVLTGKFRDFSP